MRVKLSYVLVLIMTSQLFFIIGIYSRRSTDDLEKKKPNVLVYTNDNLSFPQLPRPRHQPLKSWELEYLGMPKYRRWLNDSRDLCRGSSTIVCPRLPEHDPKKAYFCFGTNILQKDVATWTAHCESFIDETDLTDFMQDTDPKNPLVSGSLKMEQHAPPPQMVALPERRLTYLATGDCITGNPGHSIADPHNLFIIQQLLGFNRTNTEVVLLTGFGSNIYGLSSSNVWLEDWQALAVSVHRQIPTAPDIRLHTVAFGALGMHGPHWRRFKDNGMVRGRSQILLDILTNIELFLGRSPPVHDRTLLWIRRASHRRILNQTELVADAISDGWSARDVDLGDMSYRDQYSAVTSHSVVIGMHGGGMWNAARWMRSSQAMVEVLPVLGPGSTKEMATLMGFRYEEVQCETCVASADYSGNVAWSTIGVALGRLYRVEVLT